MKLNELCEGSFDGMTGGEDKNPLKLKKKITVKPIGNMTGSLYGDDEKFFYSAFQFPVFPLPHSDFRILSIFP